jgi:multiple sugar transport system ATP-binding protein
MFNNQYALYGRRISREKWVNLARVLLENVKKTYGDVNAVDGVGLEIADKEFLTLLGPSGCGKTTTLRLIAGLETLTAGNIYIGDRLVNDVAPRDRNIAMVFQSYALYPHMTVYGNIAFPLKIRKTNKTEIDKRVKEVADILEISDKLKRKPSELSGGERQRVALGRAIVRKPDVFLMDEPLSNLDAKLRIYMRAELKRLQKRLDTTLIYVTHDQVEAMTMSDRIAIMNEGNLQQVDAPGEIYFHPLNMWVAGFIGSPPMNFMNCSLVEKNGQGILDAAEFQLSVPKSMLDVLRISSSVSELVLGIRPEDMRVSKQAIPNGIEGKVYVTEPIGDSVIVDVRIGGTVIRAKADPYFQAVIEDKVYVTFSVERMHVFDRKGTTLV